LKACAQTASSHDTSSTVIQLLSNIRGPYAIVFYDAVNKHVYYGRDCLGRRSLLNKSTSDGSLVLSSVCDNATGEAWAEVEADGIYFVDLNDTTSTQSQYNVTRIPHTRISEPANTSLSFVGRCLIWRCLLTSAGFAISTHESRNSYPCW
jgi:glutamine phosphoribosylpyrophosphate amidotransferase